MDLIAPISTSVVAVLSLILSIYTLYVTRRRASREIHARFVERIVDKRIAAYPELWTITGKAFRESEEVREEDFNVEWAREFLRRLWDWYYTEGNGIFMNEDSKDAFFALQLALKEFDPLRGREEVRAKAQTLRKELRADLKLERRLSETTEI